MKQLSENINGPLHKRIPACVQNTYDRFVRLRGNPREIALGFSLGLFIGITPLVGMHTFLAILIASLLKWNKISAAIGVWITNPLVAPFIYGVNYLIGSLLFPLNGTWNPPPDLGFSAILNILYQTPRLLLILTVGGIITGIPVSIAGYFVTHSLLVRYQDKIRKKLEERKLARNKRKQNRIRKRKKQNRNNK